MLHQEDQHERPYLPLPTTSPIGLPGGRSQEELNKNIWEKRSKTERRRGRTREERGKEKTEEEERKDRGGGEGEESGMKDEKRSSLDSVFHLTQHNMWGSSFQRRLLFSSRERERERERERGLSPPLALSTREDMV
jgi:hypothetical protein